MSKEVKIGLFTILSIGIGIWGFKYLMGNNILDSSTVVYAKYKEIDGIRRSTPVLFKGYPVGLVSDIYTEDATYDNSVVKMNINEGLMINRNAVMQITTTSVMGDKAVILLNNEHCNATKNCVESGDYLKGVTRGMLGSMLGADDLSTYVNVLTEEFKKLFQTLGSEMKQGGNKLGVALNDFGDAMTNVKSLTGRLDGLLATSSGNINGTLANLKNLTDTLETSAGDIKSLISNADGFAENLKNMELESTVGQAKKTLTKLEGTLVNADKMFKNIEDILTKMKSADGAVAMLLSDPTFANKLKLTVTDLDLFLQDLRLHPERYRRILSKKTKEYEVPEDDPSRKGN
jgi:phospholipid/cholesterol/gamma-HCH transport system substrate-binding protein